MINSAANVPPSYPRIWMPPRTKLMTVFRLDDGWQCFTACPNPGAKYQEMLGSSLILRDNGYAFKSVWRPDHRDDEIQVYP